MEHRPLAPQRASAARLLRARRGYLGWWIAGALALVSFSRVPFFNPVLGIFIAPLEEEFGWSRTTIVGALSLGTVGAAVIAPFLGPVVDRYGGRAFIVASVAVCGVLLLLLAAVGEIWEFYLLFGLGRAIVLSILDIAIVVTVANWFIRQRGRAMGLMALGSRGGVVVMPLVTLLFLSLFDWRAAFLALGVVVLIVAVAPPWLVVRRRPEDVGQRPDGDSPRPPELLEESEGADPRWTARQAIRTRAFWLLLLGTSQLYLVGGAVSLTMVSHFQDNGLSQGTAVTVVTLWALVGIGGGMAGGELRRRLPIRYSLPAASALTAGAVAWLIVVDNVWMAYVFAAWHGATFGVQLPLQMTSFPDYFGRWSVGAIRGLTAPVQLGLNALGPLLATLVFDSRGSYDLIFGVFAGLMGVGAVLILLAAPPRHKAAPSPAS